jgi:glycosyltransferase involved in cell wall biosynthesis
VKIWLLTSETPRFNPGGIARYVDNFARYLARDGHDVTVFGRDDDPADTEIEPGYHYRSVVPRWNLTSKESNPPAVEHPAYPYNILDYWSAFSYQMAEVVIAEIEKSGPPDVIESQEYCAVPYYLLQRKLIGESVLRNVPVVVNAHSPDFIIREANEEVRYQFPHYWTGRQELFCFHAADANICPSAYLTRDLEARFGGSIQVQHFPLPWTAPTTALANAPVETGKVVYFGRLEVRKGVLELIKTCNQLWNQGLAFTVHLIGSDTDYRPRGCTVGEWVKRCYGKHIEAGRLVIHGSMPHDSLMQEMASASCTVIPSRWENWPNTCIEAMAHGKVVVASQNGGQAEMVGIDERCGFVFDHNEPDGMANALKKALALSPAQRDAMGKVAMARIAQFCEPTKVVQERLNHFRSLTAHKRNIYPFTNRRLRTDWMTKASDANEVYGRVSVVIPHYNLGEYVGASVDAALSLDWKDVEIILVDDGSTDVHSREVVGAIEQQRDPRIQVIRQPNRGLAEARNTGVSHATGEFILLLDADDTLSPDFITRAMPILRQYDNVHIVYSWEQYMQASRDVYPCWNFEFPYLLGHNMTCPISILYRQSYLRCGGSNPNMVYNFEDYELWIRMVAKGCGGVSIPETLSNYRIRENSMWQASPRCQHVHLQELIMEAHRPLYEEYGAELFVLQNANGPSQKWIKPAANSPFDTYEEWSRRRINNLEKSVHKWWKKTTELDKRLQAAEREKEKLWEEKNALLGGDKPAER